MTAWIACHHFAQVDGDRLTPRDQLVAQQIDLHVQLIDHPLVGEHVGDQPQVVQAQRFRRAPHLALDQPAHRHDGAAHSVDVGVEAAVSVFVNHLCCSCARVVSRSGR